MRERPQHQDLDDASRPPSLFRRQEEALQELERLVNGAPCTFALIPRQEHPGQGDVLELAQVAEVVVSGQALLTRPAQRVAEPALRDPDPCLQRRDRPHVGEEVAHVQALRLVEQVKCAGQISFSLLYPGHRHPPAIPVLRQPGVLTQLLARQQVLDGGRQVVALAVELAHPRVHVCRSPQNRAALRRDKLQCLLVGVHRLAEATLRDPDVGQRDRAAQDVGDETGSPQSGHARGPGPVRSLQVPVPPGRKPKNPDAEARPRWSSSGERSSARRACRTVPGASPRAMARAARYTSIAAGRRRYSSSLAATISASGPCRPSWGAVGAASHRSASRSRSSTPSSSPVVSNAPAKATLSTGLSRTSSSGSASSQRRAVASCLVLRMAGIASSTRPAARSKSSAASAWLMATGCSSFCSYHALARRCRSGTWPGCSSSSRACSTSAKRWW